jgi:unsaturated pyranuronate lyase
VTGAEKVEDFGWPAPKIGRRAMDQSDVFVKPRESDGVAVAPGIRRRLLGFNGDLMLVEVAFEQDAEGAIHSHPHVQSSYVASGRFEMKIGARTQILEAGDSYFVPPRRPAGRTVHHAGIGDRPPSLCDGARPDCL